MLWDLIYFAPKVKVQCHEIIIIDKKFHSIYFVLFLLFNQKQKTDKLLLIGAIVKVTDGMF